MPGHVDRRREASPLGRQRSRDGFRQARCASYFVKVPNSPRRKLGIADGMYNIPDSIDDCNDEIARMFGVSE